MFFCVVEFSKRYGAIELAVVPLMWITKKNKCYWPPTTNKQPLSLFIQTNPLPNKQWRQYKIEKIRFKTESYSAAENELERIISECEDSISASNVSNDGSVIRKRTLSHSSSSSSDTNVNLPLHYQQTEPSTPDDVSSRSLTIIPIEADILNEPERPLASSLISEALSQNIVIDGIIDPRSAKNSQFEETMLSAVANLQTQQTQMLLTLNEILRYHKKIAMENLVEPENLPEFPLKTLEEFQDFENFIRDDEIIRQYMVRRLAALGGSGVESITRRIMKYLMSNDLAINFNWKGRFTKKSFEHTNSMGIIYDAAKQTFPAGEHSDMLVSKAVKEWLKHAVTRIKQGVRRQISENQHN